MVATVMTNNQVIPITAGVRKPKRRRVAVRAAKGPEGIEIHVELLAESPALSPPQPGGEPMEVSAVGQPISFRGCSETEEAERTYWITSDNRVGVCAPGQAKPADVVVSFSNVEELTTLTSDWRMPQVASVWNQIPGARKVVRFENRSVALERLWQAIERLPLQEAAERDEKYPQGEKKKRAGKSKSEHLIGLLRTPGGITLQGLMEASGWQAHSVRGFLSGKLGKQLGLAVESFRRDGERVYALQPAETAKEQPE